MPCINADGTLTSTARRVLAAVAQPLTVEGIREVTGQPLFHIRLSLREMEAAGLVTGADGCYTITPAGRERL